MTDKPTKGTIVIRGIDGSKHTFPFRNLRQFKRMARSIQKEQFFEYFNGFMRCDQIASMDYYLDKGYEEEEPWMYVDDDDDDKGDDDDDDPKPIPTGDGGKEIEWSEDDEQWLKDLTQDKVIK